MLKNYNFYNLENSQFARAVADLLKESRGGELVPFYRDVSLFYKIRRVYNEVKRFKQRGLPMLDAESWLLDNCYLVKRMIEKGFSTALPSIDGEPRILVLARFVVANSLKNITKERIMTALKAAETVVNLTVAELRNFNTALSYALVEGVYVLAERLAYFRRMQRNAQGMHVERSSVKSDVYLHYAALNPCLKGELHEVLATTGIDPDDVEEGFVSSVAMTDKIAESVFDAMINVDELTPLSCFLDVLAPTKILAESRCFDHISEDTKLYYLSFVERIARKLKTSEKDIAAKLIGFSSLHSLDISDVIFCYKKSFVDYVRLKPTNNHIAKDSRVWREYIYAVIPAILALCTTIALGILWLGVYAIVAFLPFVYLYDGLFLKIAPFFVVDSFIPRCNYTSIPDTAKTLVVVSEYIPSVELLKDAIKHGQRLALSAGRENVRVALLVDFASSDKECDDGDRELLDIIDAYQGDDLDFFVRRRVLYQGKFVARDRKRGAIEDLNTMLITGDKSQFVYVKSQSFVPTFVYLLDHDNVYDPGGVLDVLNVMMHPYARHYDICVPKCKYNVSTADTPFARSYAQGDGYELYPMYSNLYFDMFGKDIFCGKGLYRVKNYEKVLSGGLPENKLLSHDLVEGAILNSMPGGVVYEDAPASFAVSEKRHARWLKGDLQVLPVVLTMPHHISPFYTAIALKNATKPIVELALLAMLILGLLLALPLLYTALGIVFLPFVVDLIIETRALFDGKRCRYYLQDVLRNFLATCRCLLMLPYRALQDCAVLLATCKDIITSTNLTRWVTFAETKGDSQLNVFIPSMLLCLAIFIGVFFVGTVQFFAFSCYFVLVMLEYARLVASSITKVDRGLGENDRALLLDIAKRTYEYFQLVEDRDTLIPDNYQFDPYIGASNHTSPTDLGCALLAEVSALALDIVKEDVSFKKIKRQLRRIDKLPKWHGNLYNWYDVHGGVLDRFVSSVDSGNLLACLIVVAECARAYNQQDVYQLAKKLIENTHLHCLFDQSKSLFYLGYHAKTKKYSGHYDLLASESRLLSYVYSALYCNSDNWNALMRDYTRDGGNTLLSWSGTMFEYLLPRIFIKPTAGTLLADTQYRAVKIQSRRRICGLWGRSECGKYEFDKDGRYQYYAYGERELSLRGEDNAKVIAPYASLLALQVDRGAMSNVRRLIARGMVNKTGFFESVDCRQRPNIIYSQMTHHQGMIIASICNVLKDDYVSKLFLANPKMAAATTLLAEKTSKIRPVKKIAKKSAKLPIVANDYFENSTKREYLQRMFSSSNGNISLLIDKYGNNKCIYKNTLLSQEPSSYRDTFGGVYFVKRGTSIFSPTKAPFYTKQKYRVTLIDGGVIYANDSHNCELFVKKCDAFAARYTQLTVDVGSVERPEIAFFEKVTLAHPMQYASHSVYSNMMIRSEYLRDYSTILFTKLDPGNQQHLYCAYVIKGLEDMQFSTDREKVLQRYKNQENTDFFTKKLDCYDGVGEVLNPCICVRGVPTVYNGKGKVEIITLFSEDKEKLLNNIRKVYETEDRFYRYCYDVEMVDSAFSAAFLAYFASNPSRVKQNSTIIYQGLRDKYLAVTAGKMSILYKPYDKLSSLQQLLKAVNLARSFGYDLSVIVYLDKRAVFKYDQIARCFDGHSITHGIYLEDSCSLEELRLFATLELDESLTIPLKAVENSKKPIQKYIEQARPVDKRDLDYRIAKGGFREDGDYILTEGTDLPYSNVVAMDKGGFVATENGGGYTFFGNSRERKVSEFYSEYLEDAPTEKVLLITSKGCYRINKGGVNGGYTRYGRGEIEYFNHFGEFSTITKQFMIDDGDIKVISVNVDGNVGGEISYRICPSLYWTTRKDQLALRASGDTLVITNMLTADSVYIRALTADQRSVKVKLDLDALSIATTATDNAPVYFVLSSREDAVLELKYQDIVPKRHDALTYFDSINRIAIKTKDKGLDILFNKYLLYQTVSSRLNAKMGYYQVGGATGFRDQLQDAVALRYQHPDILRRQIIACVCHQYKEGDVQHWWHEPCFGIRTKISDDKLFLPYAVAEYIEATGDSSILAEEYPYLISPPLGAKEMDRVEIPEVSREKISIKEHCFRAIKSALRLGEHGLLIMGNGDWNDGLNNVGAKCHGESVVSTLMLIIAIDKLKGHLDDQHRLSLYSIAEGLKNAVNKYGYDGTQYVRLYRDNGDREGGKGDKAIAVDVVSEALAVLAGVATGDRAQSALDGVSELLDYQTKTVRLLAPYQSMEDYLGYICAYPQGVRENGGQYTHGAIWYVWALLKVGQWDMAYEIARFFNPITRYQTEGIKDSYLGEPFVLAGDIYAGRYAGRMGWSWYTGSAGWYYRLILEGFFGLKKHGNYLDIHPRLPKALDGSILEYTFGQSVYTIKFVNSGQRRIVYDGTTLDTDKIPLVDNKKIAILVEF